MPGGFLSYIQEADLVHILIYNPVAGNGFSAGIIEKLQTIIRDEFHGECRIVKTEYPGHAEELAAEAARDPETGIVFAVGGDGTVSEAARGMAGTGKPFGIIPAGTGNDFIKSVHIPREPEEALRFALSHEPRDIDICALNDSFFLNLFGTGFDVLSLDYAARYKDKMRGMMPYLLGVLQAVFHSKGHRRKITVDGKNEEGTYLMVTVGNGNCIGGGFAVNPEARPDDGKLDVVIIRNVARWKILFYLTGLINGRHLRYKITKHLKADHVIIEGEGMRVDADGAVLPMERAEISVKKGALRLICPKIEQNS